MQTATIKFGDSPNEAGPNRAAAKRKAEARSGVTNGRDILPGVDGRSQIARRYFDIQSAICTEQSGAITETRLQLIRRFAAAAVLAEAIEAKLANGEEIDISEHALLVSTMVRVANNIGLNRIAIDVTAMPSVASIISEQLP